MRSETLLGYGHYWGKDFHFGVANAMDAIEDEIGTGPYDRDSDDDGLMDGEEVNRIGLCWYAYGWQPFGFTGGRPGHGWLRS